jgi:glutamyl-tRNA reductase
MVVALSAAGVAEVLVANRTPERAEALAEQVGGRAIGLFELPQALREVDLLLTSTGAQSVMVEHTELEPVVEARAGRPLLIVDVAVPRDVAPSVAELPNVTLLDMDDLRAFADAGLTERRREALRARDVIDEEVARFRDVSSGRQAAPVIAALRDRIEEMRSVELERVARGLGDDERAALDRISRNLIGKLLHEPTMRLKDAAGTMRGERLAEALRELFDLE